MNWNSMTDQEGFGGDITVYDPSRKSLHLKASDQVARGGGGAVYAFRSNDRFMIKVCKASQQKRLSSKIKAMLKIKKLSESSNYAWPRMPVYNARGDVIGFVMNRCQGRTMRSLFVPKLIRRHYPGWDRLQLAEVALNFVKNIQELAREHVLINDFNPDNFLITPTGQVQFIDCDSFQIPGGFLRKTFISETFMPEYSAPELVLDPKNVNRERTPEEIRFSLAIIVYMILMSGLHPFARINGSDPVENLKSGRCPLSPKNNDRIPKPWVASLSWLPDSLRHYFTRMFVDGYKNPSARPMIEELKEELKKFISILRSCHANEPQRAILPQIPRLRRRKAQ